MEVMTEQIWIAAMYAGAANADLWKDRPTALAQAAHDTLGRGPAVEDINHVLNLWAPPKTHPAVWPVQLVG